MHLVNAVFLRAQGQLLPGSLALRVVNGCLFDLRGLQRWLGAAGGVVVSFFEWVQNLQNFRCQPCCAGFQLCPDTRLCARLPVLGSVANI